MTDPMNLPRRHGEKEKGQILKRGTELQHDEPCAPSADSLTLQELEEVAAEAGIDPVYLRRAAFEVDAGTVERYLGEVRGRGAPARERDHRRGRTPRGRFRTYRRSHRTVHERAWTIESARSDDYVAVRTSNKHRTVQITVASRDGQTSIRLEESLRKLAGEFFGACGSMGGTEPDRTIAQR